MFYVASKLVGNLGCKIRIVMIRICKKVSVDLLGLLHVDPVCQAYNQCGYEEADYNSNHHLGLVTVL